MTRYWVTEDPVRQSSQMGAKPASKAWPRAWQSEDAADHRVIADPPL